MYDPWVSRCVDGCDVPRLAVHLLRFLQQSFISEINREALSSTAQTSAAYLKYIEGEGGG